MNSSYNEYFEIETGSGLAGIMSCRRCGATVIIHKTENAIATHDAWHDAQKKKESDLLRIERWIDFWETVKTPWKVRRAKKE